VTKLFLSFGAILAGLSVAAGAFASHALKDNLSDRALEIFETGSKYQMYHALALLIVGQYCSVKERVGSWFADILREQKKQIIVSIGLVKVFNSKIN